MAIQARAQTAPPARKTIRLDVRSWASRREYQRFLGTYVLDQNSGFYFDSETTLAHRDLISSALAKVTPALSRLALSYGLTLSTCPNATAAGHSSTFYGNFDQPDPARVSPHIEVSARSLEPAYLLPHLTHELSHLWWRNLPDEQRRAYTEFLVNTCVHNTREVTDYAQEQLDAYREALVLSGRAHASLRRERALKQWSEESFCETVALLSVGSHPGFKKNTTVDIEKRRQAVARLARLPLRRSSASRLCRPWTVRRTPPA